MSTYETAEDKYVDVDGVRHAYRWFGAAAGIPLVMLAGFRCTMDHWDPALVNPLAAARPVILLDVSGVGRSAGEVPRTFGKWADSAAAVLAAIGVTRADVLGYSMGGCAAQLLTLDAAPRRGIAVRRLILAGTTPSSGPGVTPAPDLKPFMRLRGARGEDEQRAVFLDVFFNTSERCRAAGVEAWRRMTTARPARVAHLGPEGARTQAIAFAKFMDPKGAAAASFSRLHEIRIPVLVANGRIDLLLPSENSYTLWKGLVNADAHLHLYPDSGHGFLFQYADHFSAMVNDFLDAPEKSAPPAQPASRL